MLVATLLGMGVATVAGSGGNVLRVTVRRTVSAFVAESVAMTTIVFTPTTRSTLLLNAPLLSVTATPFTLTSFSMASLAVPVAVTVGVDTVELSAGAVTVNVGRCVSRLPMTTCVVEAFPAESFAMNTNVFGPSGIGGNTVNNEHCDGTQLRRKTPFMYSDTVGEASAIVALTPIVV